MRIKRNLSQIRAEVLLNYLYPEMEDQWIAINKGTFYRNYNQDALAIEEKESKAILARDGFLRLLPEGLLTIGEWAFYGCTGLSGNLSFPNTLKSIDKGAFGRCVSLTSRVSISD